VVEEECPEPKDGEVRVRVLAAGVSLPDLLMRDGVHPEKPPLPFTPGWDLIGVVDRLGKGVSGVAKLGAIGFRSSSSLSWNRHLRVVHRWRLASPGPETAGPRQHPVAQTAETGIVSTESARPL
jgi:NADPH:quinone reductase-like Zn-dependent oxidoreductase